MGRRLKAHDTTKATRPKPSEVTVTRLAHPKVWSTAIKLAQGKTERIHVETYSKVWVTL